MTVQPIGQREIVENVAVLEDNVTTLTENFNDLNLLDIAEAGTNITIQKQGTINSHTNTVGSPVFNGALVSGLSNTNYLETVPSPTYTTQETAPTTWEYGVKFKITSSTLAASYLAMVYSPANSQYYFSLAFNASGTLFCQVYDTTNTVKTASVSGALPSVNVDFWLKAVYTTNTSLIIYSSTDGVNYTQIAVASSAPAGFLRIGGPTDWFRIGVGSASTPIEVDLSETYWKIDGVEVWRGFAESGKYAINSSVPASVLQNTSTGTSSLTVSTVANSLTGFTGFGVNSQGANYAVSIGLSAKVGYGAVSLGMEAQSGAGSNYAICLGWKAKVAASCPYAIQIGTGTNSTANSLSVGLDSSKNYTLLTSDGTIPGPRMALQNAGAPTTSTAGSVGQFYVDTTNQDAYICVSDASSTYTWKKITP